MWLWKRLYAEQGAVSFQEMAQAAKEPLPALSRQGFFVSLLYKVRKRRNMIWGDRFEEPTGFFGMS